MTTKVNSSIKYNIKIDHITPAMINSEIESLNKEIKNLS